MNIFVLLLASGIDWASCIAGEELVLQTNHPGNFIAEFGHAFKSFSSPHSRPMMLYVISLILLTILVLAIYHRRGVMTCVAILSYVMSLSSMSMTIRNCYINHSFKFPEFLTAAHFLTTAIVAFCILLCKLFIKGKSIQVPNTEILLKRILPIGCTIVASLGLANYAILYTNTHFYEMLSCTTPLITALIAFCLGHDFNGWMMMPLILITAGMVVVGMGEISFSLVGLFCVLAAAFMRAAKANLQSVLLQGTKDVQMDPVEAALWTSLVSFKMMSCWSFASVGVEPFRHLMGDGTIKAVMLSCACASVINIAALFVLRELGPVMQQIVGQLKGIVSCMGAMAFFGEAISLEQQIGYTILLLGVAWYNAWDMHFKTLKGTASKSQTKDCFDESSKLVHSKI